MRTRSACIDSCRQECKVETLGGWNTLGMINRHLQVAPMLKICRTPQSRKPRSTYSANNQGALNQLFKPRCSRSSSSRLNSATPGPPSSGIGLKKSQSISTNWISHRQETYAITLSRAISYFSLLALAIMALPSAIFSLEIGIGLTLRLWFPLYTTSIKLVIITGHRFTTVSYLEYKG